MADARSSANTRAIARSHFTGHVNTSIGFEILLPTITSIAYHQAVVEAMGGLQATPQFAKYYALPSVGHCGGNGPDTYDGLGAVVAWTEKHTGEADPITTDAIPLKEIR